MCAAYSIVLYALYLYQIDSENFGVIKRADRKLIRANNFLVLIKAERDKYKFLDGIVSKIPGNSRRSMLLPTRQTGQTFLK